MPVEMRRDAPEAVAAAKPRARAEAAPDSVQDQKPDSGPGALRGLVAARLVTHEAIGDPARLVGEAATLRAICRLVSGHIYRIEPFHYAFAARPDDLDGALAGLDAEAQAETLDAALAGILGAEAVWIGATDLVPDEAGVAGGGDGSAAAPETLPDGALLALRARGAALEAGIAAAGPDLQAVVDAAYAVECARLTAAAETRSGPIADRLAAIDATLADLRAGLPGQVGTAEALSGISDALGLVVRGLEEQSEALRAHAARQDALSARLEALVAAAAAPAAGFEERLGLTLAEFLARLERRAEDVAVPARAPQAG